MSENSEGKESSVSIKARLREAQLWEHCVPRPQNSQKEKKYVHKNE